MTQSKRYIYSCATCESPVTKTSCGQKGDKGAYTGLHGWSCGKCGDGVKVSRKIK